MEPEKSKEGEKIRKETKEVIKRMKEDNKSMKEENELKEKRIYTLLKKKKKIFKSYYERVPFEEPVVFLTRRDGKTEIYEGQKKLSFVFEHSDGERRTILLTPKLQRTLDYGKGEIKWYDCHEDHATPIPEDPIVTSEAWTNALDSTLNVVKDWKAEEKKALGELLWKVGIAIAAIILAAALFYMFNNGHGANPQAINDTLNATKHAVTAYGTTTIR